MRPGAGSRCSRSGRVTSTFTASLLLRLAAQRSWRSRTRSRILPEWSFGGAPITLELLLAHAAGAHYTDMPEWIPRWREDMTVETLFALFKDKPLDFPPGTLWSYSNSGYILLGRGDRAGDRLFNELSRRSGRERLRLGMTDSRYGHQEEIVAAASPAT